MPGPTLLARIRKPEAAGARRSVSEREERESILANLAAMCNTRVGTMLTAGDYGIATISEMVYAFPEAVQIMAATLKHSIQAYEPRLQNVQVIHVPSETIDLTLKFEVRARAVVEGSKSTVKFETALDPTRRLTIR